MIYENVNEGLVKGWDEEIKIVLVAIYRFEQKLQAGNIYDCISGGNIILAPLSFCEGY